MLPKIISHKLLHFGQEIVIVFGKKFVLAKYQLLTHRAYLKQRMLKGPVKIPWSHVFNMYLGHTESKQYLS